MQEGLRLIPRSSDVQPLLLRCCSPQLTTHSYDSPLALSHRPLAVSMSVLPSGVLSFELFPVNLHHYLSYIAFSLAAVLPECLPEYCAYFT